MRTFSILLVLGLASGCASAPTIQSGDKPTLLVQSTPAVVLSNTANNSFVSSESSSEAGFTNTTSTGLATPDMMMPLINNSQPAATVTVEHNVDMVNWLRQTLKTRELHLIDLVETPSTKVFVGVTKDVGAGIHFSIRQ